MSLRVRIVGLVALVVALAVVGVGVMMHRSTEASLVAEIDDDLLERAEVIDRGGETERARGGPLTPEQIERLQQFDPLAERGSFEQFRGRRADPFASLVSFDALARVIDESGSVRIVLDDDFDAPVDSALLDSARVEPVLSDGTAATGAVRVVTVALPQSGFVQFARPLAEVESALAELRTRTVAIGLAAIAAAGLLAWFLAGRTVRPIQDLTAATEHIAATGDIERGLRGRELAAVAEAEHRSEVGRLSGSFAAMVHALSESRRQQRQLVMDASHELRTPLTSLRTNIDVLQRGHALRDEDREAVIADIDAELDDLGDLVVELVDLAADVRADEEVAPVTLAEVADPVVARARRRTGRTIDVEVARTVVLEARPEALARVVRNLVDNAAKFSPPDSPIRVVVDGGRLTVHDRGPGIPSAERAAVFDRFHRTEASRTLPGSGLGLAIVRQIAEAHDGEVFAAESPDGGAAVGFVLPTIDG